MGVIVRATRVGPAGTAVPLPGWTKRRHVDLCRTQTALCR
ncbi:MULTISPECIES: putative leader peptide [unclassified Streptomyces]